MERSPIVTYPSFEGHDFILEYDRSLDDGRVTKLTDRISQDVIWKRNATDAFGRVRQEEYGNGATMFSSWSLCGPELLTRRVDIGTNTHEANYAYDRAGNLRARHSSTTGMLEEFAYDSNQRLTERREDAGGTMPPVDQCGHVDPGFQPTAPVLAESWQYDPLGRISRSSAVGIISYHPSSIYEITAASNLPGTFAYDPKGNQTQRPGRTIQYSPFDLPTEITTGSAVTTLWYDGLQQRAARDVVDGGQSISSSIYAGPRFEIETRDESGIQVTRARYNIYAEGRFIGQKTVRSQPGSYIDEGFEFVHSDQLGNLHMTTDGAGAMTAIQMSAFGTPIGMNGTDHSMPIGSGDHRWDDTNGLREMGGRAFDALTSSFVSPDPLAGRLGRAADWNPYALAGQRPLLDADPSGLQVPTITLGIEIEVQPETTTPIPHISFLSNAAHFPIGGWVGGGYVSPSSGIGASLESGLASIDTALASGASAFGEFVHDATGSWILGGVANTLADVLVTVPRGIVNLHNLPSALADIPRQVGEGAAMVVEGIETGNGYTVGKGAAQLLGGVGAVAGIVAGVGSVVRGGATSAAARGGSGRLSPARATKSIRPKGCASCPCFVPGTPVLMADGSAKPIEEIREGDEILADDPSDEEGAAVRRVTAVHMNMTYRVVRIDLVTTDGMVSSVDATGEHPIWTVEDGWVAADSLVPGDELLGPNGEARWVLATAERSLYTKTYNLSVEGVHTFFVGAAGTSVLVHNGPALIKRRSF